MRPQRRAHHAAARRRGRRRWRRARWSPKSLSRSSSFRRSSRPSMEMPALATRMSSLPCRLTMPSIAASTAFESATSKPAIVGLAARRRDGLGDLARRGLALHVVDDDRRALRRERLAARAADAARAARDQRDLCRRVGTCLLLSGRDHLPVRAALHAPTLHPAPSARNAATCAIDAASPTLSTLTSLAMRFDEPGQHLARPDLERVGHALRRHEPDALVPAHGAVDLAHEQLLGTRVASTLGCASKLATTGKRGAPHAPSARARASTTRAAGAMSAQWKGALTLSGIARPFAAATSSPSARDGRRVPRDDDLPGRVEVRRARPPRPAPPRAQRASSALGLDAHDGRHRARPRRNGLLHRAPAGPDQAHARPRGRARRPRPGRSTRRASAPRRSAGWGASGTRSRMAARMAQLVATSAGCALAVSVSSSSGPSSTRRDSEPPPSQLPASAASARAKTSRAAAEPSRTSRPMPTLCEPCPGKSHAVFIARPRFRPTTRV